MDLHLYFDLKSTVIARGYSDDVTWAETVGECQSADDFAFEHAFVVCNSGMKAQIAVKIYRKVFQALQESRHPQEVFGHKGKANAIEYVYQNRERLFAEYRTALDKLAFLESLPWIGSITKYHLAKNFGFDCCKPDRHLVRIAKLYDKTPDELCSEIAEQIGERIGVVDLVLWRAANLMTLESPQRPMSVTWLVKWSSRKTQP